MDGVESQIAEWRAYVAKAPGRRRPGRRRAGGAPPRPDRRARRGRPRRRRGVPRRREADGRPRRPLPGVRPRAQRPAVEAARPERRGRDRRGRPAGGSRRSASRWPRPSRSRSPASPPGSPTRSRCGCCATPACWCCRSSPRTSPAGGGSTPGDGCSRPRRSSSPRSWPTSTRTARTRPPSFSSRPTCPSCCGSRSPTRTWAGRSLARAAHGLRPLHRRVGHLLRAHRPRRRRAAPAHRADPRADRDRRRRGRRVGGAVGRRGRGGRGGVARGVQAARGGEHGAGAHHALHPAVRRHADRRRGHLRRVRGRRGVRPRAARRLRRAPGGRARARPVRAVGAGADAPGRADGPRPAARRRERPRARRGGARRDGGPDRRSRVHPEPRGGARPQRRPAREPGRGRLVVGAVPRGTDRLPPPRAMADLLPAGLRGSGRRPSSPSSPRSSPSSDRAVDDRTPGSRSHWARVRRHPRRPVRDWPRGPQNSRGTPLPPLVRREGPAVLRPPLAHRADGLRRRGLPRQAGHRDRQHLVRHQPVPHALQAAGGGRQARGVVGGRVPAGAAGDVAVGAVPEADDDALPQPAGDGDRGAAALLSRSTARC